MVKLMRRVKTTVAALMLVAFSTGTLAFHPGFPPPGYPGQPYSRMYPGTPPQAVYPYYAYPRPVQTYPWYSARPRVNTTRRASAVTPQPHKRLPAPAADQPGTVPDDKQPGAGGDALPSTDAAQFVESLLPLIETENQRILALRQDLLDLSGRLDSGIGLDRVQRERLRQLARTYRIEGNPLEDAGVREALIRKVDSVPASLALAQAANESAWGKSRFAREGNNLFGIWTYDEDKGIVPRRRTPGKKHLVRRFDSIGESVRYYLHTLNSHPAYESMREIRAGMRASGQAPDPLLLAAGLTGYSAKGEQYVELIRDMIRRFDLAVYDARASGSA